MSTRDEPLLAQRYRFVRERGRGAAGRVVEVQEADGTPWVVKLVGAELGASLVAEYEALRGLAHDALPQVHELLRVDRALGAPFSVEPGTYALVEERVEGRDPFEVLGGLSLDDPRRWIRVAEFGARLASALDAVHARGLVHGDVKPENVRVRDDGALHLLDLGLAAPPQEEDGRVVGGTPGYIAPEVLLGQREFASDLYALGVTLHELLTRLTPRRARSSRASRSPRELVAFATEAPLPLELPETFVRVLAELREPEVTHRLADAQLAARGLAAEARRLGAAPLTLPLAEPRVEALARRLELLPWVGDEDSLEALADTIRGRLAGAEVIRVELRGPRGAGGRRTARELASRVQRAILAHDPRAVVPTWFETIPSSIDADAALVHVRAGEESALRELEAAARARGGALVAFVRRDEGAAELSFPLEPLAHEQLTQLVLAAQRALRRSLGSARRQELESETGGLAGLAVRWLTRTWLGAGEGAREPDEAARESRLLRTLAAWGGSAPLAALGVEEPRVAAEMAVALRRAWISARGEQLVLREDLRQALWRGISLPTDARAQLSAPPETLPVAQVWWSLAGGEIDDERLDNVLGDLPPVEALRLVEAAIAREPSHGGTRVRRLALLVRLGRYSRAYESRERDRLVLRDAADAEADAYRVVEVELARRSGRAEEARALAERTGGAPAREDSLRISRAWLDFADGNPARAASRLDEAWAATGLALAAAELRAWLSGGDSGARASLSAVLERAPREPPSGALHPLMPFALRESRARALASAAALEGALGDAALGEELLARALRAAESIDAEHLRATVAANLGAAEIDRGALVEGCARLRDAAAIFARLGRRDDLARAHVNLLGALRRSGEEAAVTRLLPASLANASEAAQPEPWALLRLFGAERAAPAELARAVAEAIGRSRSARVRARAVALLADHDLARAGRLWDERDETGLPPVEGALAESRLRLAELAAGGGGADEARRAREAIARLEESASRWEDRFETMVLRLRAADLRGGSDPDALRAARVLLDGVLVRLDAAGRRRFREVSAHREILERASGEDDAQRGGADARWRELVRWSQRLGALGFAGASGEELRGVALEAALELLVSERAHLISRSESADLRVLATRGGEGQAPEYSRRVAEEVLTGRQAFRTLEARSDDRLRDAQSVHALALRSIIGVPIPRVRVGERDGVEALLVEDRGRAAAFDPEDEALLEALARSAGLALDASARSRSEAEMRARLARSEERLRARVEAQGSELALFRARPSDVVAESSAMRETIALLGRVAESELPVWLRGESGVGKSRLARELHRLSSRADGPFVAESCAAIPAELLESVLFGHVRGAFTGASRDHVGLFEAASGGTLFLSSVEETSPAMQAKLLRVLQEGEVRRVGDTGARAVDARLVVSSRVDLADLVSAGTFREDLYYRLAVVPVAIPPLRARVADIPILARQTVARIAAEEGGVPPSFTAGALQQLVAYEWPGNVRELENILRSALVLEGEPSSVDEHIVSGALGRTVASSLGTLTLREAIDALEAEMVGAALKAEGGNRTRTAAALGISRYGLAKMIKRLGIEVPE